MQLKQTRWGGRHATRYKPEKSVAAKGNRCLGRTKTDLGSTLQTRKLTRRLDNPSVSCSEDDELVYES